MVKSYGETALTTVWNQINGTDIIWAVLMKGNVTRGCTYIRQRSRILLFLEHDLALCLWRTTGTQPSITHTHTLCLSLHSCVQTMMLSIHSSVQSEEFTFSSIPMTTLLRLVFMHSWQHNCRGQDNTKKPQKDMWRYEMPQPLFGLLL